MQRRVFLLLGLLIAIPAISQAAVISLVGDGSLLPETAGQVVILQLDSQGDFYTDGNFFALINGGVGPAPAVETIFGHNALNVPGLNLAGTIWAGGQAGIGSPPNGTTFNSPGLNPLVALATSAGGTPQTTSGVYMAMTVSTVGVPNGEYLVTMELTDLFNGLDGDFNPIPVPLSALPFTLSIVPEPSSIVMGLFAAAGLAAVVIRRRRAA